MQNTTFGLVGVGVLSWSTWTLWKGSLVSSAVLGAVAIATLAYAVSLFLPHAWRPTSKNGIYELQGFPVLNAWSFFNKRFDFLWSNFRKTGEDIFQFQVLQHKVVALSGEESRKVFFNDKNLNFTEGYKILMGAAPDMKNVDKDFDNGDTGAFSKELLTLLGKERLADVLPTLFEDMNGRMRRWGRAGRIDPFKEIYNLVFQMTVRMATCRELAGDLDVVTRLSKLYWDLEQSATPVALLLPWFPSPAKKQGKKSTTELFTLLNSYVDLRRKADVPSSDAIDVLIAKGKDNMEICGFVLNVIFAGVINTGIQSCWNLIYLGANPGWKAKVVDEVNSLIAKYTDTTSVDPLHKRLSAIPIYAWEDEMPAMDLAIRETLRLTQTGTVLRRNVASDLSIGDKKVSKGSFLAYSIADVHLSPDIYSDPMRFDPERYLEGRQEDRSGTFSYLGWGAGRHPCTGMKVAKLEIKVIMAQLLAGYEFEIVNDAGDFPVSLPQPDRNDIHQARPVGEPCYLQFRRTEE